MSSIIYARPKKSTNNDVIPEFYPGSRDRVTDPFYVTKCSCGNEFWRIHKRQVVTCNRCGRMFEASLEKEKRPAD